jgi:hypothetical protein
MLARLLLVCLVVGCSKVSPEEAAMQKTAKAQAEETQNALVKGDYGKIADLTHPKVIEELGGREKMIEITKQGLDAIKAGGVEIKSVKVLEPSVPVKSEKAVWIHVPFDLEMKAPGKRISARGGLIGVSTDNGKTWKFIDTSLGRDALKKFVPDMPDKLEIPKMQQPKVVADD